MARAILHPGRNVWRVERAGRASVLIDGAAFFGAVRRAFLKARRSIFIVGWDIDSRMRLVGESNMANDGCSPVLAEFLGELVASRPDLHVYLLLWDYSIVYVNERELFPRLSLQWRTPPRVMLCMDNAVPFGSSQHQKLIVVDDSVAFTGGLDLALRRWDTSEHSPEHPGRIDVSGCGYPPFHDVQLMVDGPAALALAVLARRRWCRAHGTEPPIDPVGDPWPEDVPPQFTDVNVGIARTEPGFEGQLPVREVETLFLDSIDRAQRTIYIENQFMTSSEVANRLALRLRERPQLEVLAVSPRCYGSWIESRTLGDERIRFKRMLEQAGGSRVRVAYPAVNDGTVTVDTSVHSKVMVVDDRLLRIGSANLNNRSMAVDTECDVAIEAGTDAERAAITSIRNLLLADHCGVDEHTMALAIDQHSSLIAATDRFASNGHRLCPVEDSEPSDSMLTDVLGEIVDPKGPLTAKVIWNRIGTRAKQVGSAIFVVGAAVVLLSVLWYFTPISEFATPRRAADLLSAAAGSPWAPAWVILAYLVGGLIAFPVVVLIVATAATFGPWPGFPYALTGVLASALLTYLLGGWLGRDAIRRMLGSRYARIQREVEQRGLLAVAAIRTVPIAPFTLVNLVAGACAIAPIDYLVGTTIGMLPGLIAASLLGRELAALLSDFSAEKLAVLLLIIVGWVAIAWSAQSIVIRLRRRATRPRSTL